MLSLPCSSALKSMHDYWKNLSVEKGVWTIFFYISGTNWRTKWEQKEEEERRWAPPRDIQCSVWVSEWRPGEAASLLDCKRHEISPLSLPRPAPGFGYWIISLSSYFPGDSGGRESACNAGDLGSIPGSGRSPGEGNGNPLQDSCLGNPMDKGAWQATVHGIAELGTTELTDKSSAVPVEFFSNI